MQYQTPFRAIFFAVLFFLFTVPAQAIQILNMNVFDQLQGEWKKDFRATRIQKLSQWIHEQSPDIVVFQEAQGETEKSKDSSDAAWIKKMYSYRKYVHEMTGYDHFSYGYWMGAKHRPVKEFSDGFSFPGGVARKTQAAIWDKAYDGKECLGILSLHMSYQTSEVRQKEAQWIIDWVKAHEVDCAHWIVMGDFNADKQDKEIQMLFTAGFKSVVKDLQPTVGAFNPIRQIYGKDIPSKTIDWAFAWNADGRGTIVFSGAVDKVWLSDHAAVYMDIGTEKFESRKKSKHKSKKHKRK